MNIGQFKEYKSYVGSIEYDEEDELYYGKLLNIRDLINYHASNVMELYQHYKDAVDDYIEFKKEIGKE
jgi:predicted HicB family RNase H-like nuclease